MAYDKKKFIEAVLFFAKNTDPKRYGVLKAMKLLYFSDLEHLKRYHRTITGDQYTRIQNGPIPTKSYAIISEVSPSRTKIEIDPDLRSAIKIAPFKTRRGDQFRIIPKRDFNAEVLSDSDIEVMQEFAEIWKDATADQIREGSYEWTQKNLGINLRELAIGETIPHALILASPEERRFVEESERETAEFERLLHV